LKLPQSLVDTSLST